MSTEKLLTGQEVVVMDEEFLKKWEEKEVGYNHGLVRIMPHGHLFPGVAPTFLNKIYNFNFRSGDVIVMTYPKTGTTWMQEILWTMIHNPDLNNPDADVDLLLRTPEIANDIMADNKFIRELPSFSEYLRKLNPDCKPEDGVMIQITEHTPGRRVIKTHLPLELLPPNLLDRCKVVYVSRNPMDTVVSFYHFWKVMELTSYKRSLDDFVNDFVTNNLVLGSFWHHLQQGWEKRNNPNLEFVFYEDMKGDIMGVLKRLDKFIGTNLTQQQLDNVKEHTSFNKMKARGEPLKDKVFFNEELLNKSGGFYRKGEVGTWKNELTPEQVEKLNDWIQDNIGKLGSSFKWPSCSNLRLQEHSKP